MSLRFLPSSLGSIRITVWEEMSFEEFPNGCGGSHLGCLNGTNLAVLNRHVSPMHLTKFQLNPTYHSKADVVSRFLSWPPWRPSWTLERNEFSISKSPCHPNAFHQVWANPSGAEWFEDFQAGHHGGALGYWNETILAILNLYTALMPPIKFQFNPTYGLNRLGGDVVLRFSRWPIWLPSWILEQNDFSNSNSPCGLNTSHQVWALSDLGFRSRCSFKIFKMAAMAAILDSRTE